MFCTSDRSTVPVTPDSEDWVDDDFFGWVHHTDHWHTVSGVRLRKLRGALAFVEAPGPGEPRRPSPPAVPDEDLDPEP